MKKHGKKDIMIWKRIFLYGSYYYDDSRGKELFKSGED